MKKITKAVFPVAGTGTRFLPVTKTTPKEMLPIVDKPLIQYAVAEAVAADIRELIFIINRAKWSVVNYFKRDYRLEAELEKHQNAQALENIRNILPEDITSICVIQEEPLGLGHAVLCARPAVNNEPFAVLLPDDLIDDGDRGATRQLLDNYHERGKSIIAVENVAKENISKYGIVDTTTTDDASLHKIKRIIEKPDPEKAPSTLGVVGRYIFNPEIFDCLENTPRGINNEIQLTDAIRKLLNTESVYAREFQGRRYDCGSKSGYLQASIDYALKDNEMNTALRRHLATLYPILQ